MAPNAFVRTLFLLPHHKASPLVFTDFEFGYRRSFS
jgi:hypothetical protein